MIHVGVGTQRISKELEKLFPHARIRIVDTPSMQQSGAIAKLFTDVHTGKIDIIIGTQMITKNWFGDHVGLGAIVDMDHVLHTPEYDGNERAFSFIVQMALRANNNKLLIQTFQPENPVIQTAALYDFSTFYAQELQMRKTLSYPPYAHLIKLRYNDKKKEKVEEIIRKTHKELGNLFADSKDITISEPYFPLVDKVRDKYRKQILIKNKNDEIPQELHHFLLGCNNKWTIDRDPVTTA